MKVKVILVALCLALLTATHSTAGATAHRYAVGCTDSTSAGTGTHSIQIGEKRLVRQLSQLQQEEALRIIPAPGSRLLIAER